MFYGFNLKSVTLHTDVGDIKLELFCEDCPKTCENFLALCASDYYNGSLFHRNIKGFIVQTGDPMGTGKGGNSIWDRKFEDEFKDNLKHTDRGMVSMANSGPNTNQSQFFFTYAAQPHLDLKYTLFGMLSTYSSHILNVKRIQQFVVAKNKYGLIETTYGEAYHLISRHIL